MAGLALVVTGVYAYRPNDVQETYALTALLAFVLSAWASLALLRSETASQREVTTVAVGGAGSRAAADLTLCVLASALVATVLVAFPLVVDAFDRSPGAVGVVAASFAHGASGLCGAALGRLVSPPTVARPSLGMALIVAAFLATCGIGAVARDLAGPMSVSQAFADAAPDSITVRLILAGASCIAAAASAELVVRWVASYRG